MRRALAGAAVLALIACGDPYDHLASPVAQQHGRALYQRHCVLCHGRTADGQGVLASGLPSRPAVLTGPNVRETDPEALYRIIREGVPGTPMPAWKGALSTGETWDVIAFLLAERKPRASEEEGS